MPSIKQGGIDSRLVTSSMNAQHIGDPVWVVVFDQLIDLLTPLFCIVSRVISSIALSGSRCNQCCMGLFGLHRYFYFCGSGVRSIYLEC